MPVRIHRTCARVYPTTPQEWPCPGGDGDGNPEYITPWEAPQPPPLRRTVIYPEFIPPLDPDGFPSTPSELPPDLTHPAPKEEPPQRTLPGADPLLPYDPEPPDEELPTLPPDPEPIRRQNRDVPSETDEPLGPGPTVVPVPPKPMPRVSPPDQPGWLPPEQPLEEERPEDEVPPPSPDQQPPWFPPSRH